MLALALAFNDIKDVSWVHEQLKKCEPDDAGRPEKRRGQWVGMDLAFARFNAGFMSEVGNCIEKADELGLLTTPAFKSAQERARREAPTSVAAWDEMVEAFQTTPGHGRRHPVAKYLKRVRNWSFHYGQDKNFKTLAAGYRAFFDAPARPDGANLRAFVSLGDTQEATRFFLADAAISNLLNTEFDELGLDVGQLRDFSKKLGLALRYLIAALLDHFESGTTNSAVS